MSLYVDFFYFYCGAQRIKEPKNIQNKAKTAHKKSFKNERRKKKEKKISSHKM
jgi:hypothetical protein